MALYSEITLLYAAVPSTASSCRPTYPGFRQWAMCARSSASNGSSRFLLRLRLAGSVMNGSYRTQSSECLCQFRTRPQETNPVLQQPGGLWDGMLGHLTGHHPSGERLQPGIMSGPKEPLLLRVP